MRRKETRPGIQPHLRLTHADRDAVAEVLREAYSQGQLDEDEFEERLDTAMRAKLGAELEPLTADLGVAPMGASGGPEAAAAAKDKPGPKEPLESTSTERVLAGVGHAGNYFFPVLVPLLIFLVSDRTSPYLRRQALESLNFQLFCIIGGIVSVLLAWLVLPIAVLLYVLVGWMVLPAAATIASLLGHNWRYPMLFRVVKDD
ncbi:DUF1707 and DUF4870 domain-containing protein [Nocardiopsis sp. Huas11]|uniref:DUF1707 and DUF4870 domain-containing protein n=1 Tax=Nocardiopsis sp. Huas11 TaxID=2183912 RepID=UPI001F307767|nr:DUF1707 and DUF4870 domain-containing protein [Nocardiopsis sp. Huas11]